MCVCERETDRQTDRDRDRERKKQSYIGMTFFIIYYLGERLCGCVRACVRVIDQVIFLSLF